MILSCLLAVFVVHNLVMFSVFGLSFPDSSDNLGFLSKE